MKRFVKLFAALLSAATIFCAMPSVPAMAATLDLTNGVKDSSLRSTLSAYDTNRNGYLEDSEIANIKNLTLSGVSKLKGIEYLTALEYLDISGCPQTVTGPSSYDGSILNLGAYPNLVSIKLNTREWQLNLSNNEQLRFIYSPTNINFTNDNVNNAGYISALIKAYADRNPNAHFETANASRKRWYYTDPTNGQVIIDLDIGSYTPAFTGRTSNFPSIPGFTGGSVPSTPTNTQRPTATNTPRPTSTPKPTATNTPRPTVTNTPRPTATNTPRPTATPKPTATNTPKPTATNTPKPTATTKPTATSKPTATNTPTPTTVAGSSVQIAGDFWGSSGNMYLRNAVLPNNNDVVVVLEISGSNLSATVWDASNMSVSISGNRVTITAKAARIKDANGLGFALSGSNMTSIKVVSAKQGNTSINWSTSVNGLNVIAGNTPTSTPRPTSTNTPTPTKKPTNTPTNTPRPTSTTRPTDTPRPTVTDTPVPTTSTGVRGFCERLYTKALGRTADQDGVNYWVQSLQNGASGAAAAHEFFFGPEFINARHSDKEFVLRLYRTFMNREPADSEINYWVGCIGSSSRETVFYAFVNSPEWEDICAGYGIKSGSNIPIKTFVARLYTECLGRQAYDVELDYWVQLLSNGQLSGSEIARQFVYSQEFISATSNNTEYINRMYKTFFGRSPANSERNYWINALNNGASRDDVFNGFVVSTEFISLCNQAGIRV